MPVNSMVASGAPLFGVRLIFRRGLGEGRQGSEEHTSELQSLRHLVCRLLLEKKKKTAIMRERRKLGSASLRNSIRLRKKRLLIEGVVESPATVPINVTHNRATAHRLATIVLV